MRTQPTPLADIRFTFAPLTGHVEQVLANSSGTPQHRAKWLLETMAPGLWRGGETIAVSDLTLCEFDACLGALYQHLFGDALPSQAQCQDCGEDFELTFSLAEFQSRLMQQSEPYGGPSAMDITAPSGRVFRLPRVADLNALDEKNPDTWLRQFLVSGAFDADALQVEISEAGPVLSQDITAPCPNCEHKNSIRFDLAAYLLDALSQDAGFLWREVHLIARQYGWGLTDILSLTREVRRHLTRLIVADTNRMRLAS